MEAKNLADIYDLPLLDCARIEARLDQGLTQAPDTGGPNRHTAWLATINPDGSPHVTGVGAGWIDGAFWFVTGEATRKGRKQAAPPTARASAVTPSEPWPSPSPRSPSSQTCRRPLEPRPPGSMGDFRQRAPTHVRRAPHRPERRHVLGVPGRLPLVCSHVRPMSGSRLIGCRHDRVGDHAGLGRAAGGRADPRGRLG